MSVQEKTATIYKDLTEVLDIAAKSVKNEREAAKFEKFCESVKGMAGLAFKPSKGPDQFFIPDNYIVSGYENTPGQLRLKALVMERVEEYTDAYINEDKQAMKSIYDDVERILLNEEHHAFVEYHNPTNSFFLLPKSKYRTMISNRFTQTQSKDDLSVPDKYIISGSRYTDTPGRIRFREVVDHRLQQYTEAFNNGDSNTVSRLIDEVEHILLIKEGRVFVAYDPEVKGFVERNKRSYRTSISNRFTYLRDKNASSSIAAPPAPAPAPSTTVDPTPNITTDLRRSSRLTIQKKTPTYIDDDSDYCDDDGDDFNEDIKMNEEDGLNVDVVIDNDAHHDDIEETKDNNKDVNILREAFNFLDAGFD